MMTTVDKRAKNRPFYPFRVLQPSASGMPLSMRLEAFAHGAHARYSNLLRVGDDDRFNAHNQGDGRLLRGRLTIATFFF